MNNVTPLPMPAVNNGPREKNGQFAKGNAGRPVGAKSRHARDLSALVRAMSNRAAQALSDAIDNRERWAVELFYRLVLPHGVTTEMNGLETADIEQAVSDGDISSERAAAMITIIAKNKAIGELSDHREQLAEALSLLKQQTR